MKTKKNVYFQKENTITQLMQPQSAIKIGLNSY
jgi:hypothetical protein